MNKTDLTTQSPTIPLWKDNVEGKSTKESKSTLGYFFSNIPQKLAAIPLTGKRQESFVGAQINLFDAQDLPMDKNQIQAPDRVFGLTGPSKASKAIKVDESDYTPEELDNIKNKKDNLADAQIAKLGYQDPSQTTDPKLLFGQEQPLFHKWKHFPPGPECADKKVEEIDDYEII